MANKIEENFIDKFEKLEEEILLLSMEKLKKIINNDTKQSDQLEAIKFVLDKAYREE